MKDDGEMKKAYGKARTSMGYGAKGKSGNGGMMAELGPKAKKAMKRPARKT